jgi:hypothetical protein
LRFDNGDNRVTRVIEFRLTASARLSCSRNSTRASCGSTRCSGPSTSRYYRPDSYACWQRWHAFQRCASKDCHEDIDSPCFDTGYPETPYCEQDAIPITLPKPPVNGCVPNNARPPGINFK